MLVVPHKSSTYWYILLIFIDFHIYIIILYIYIVLSWNNFSYILPISLGVVVGNGILGRVKTLYIAILSYVWILGMLATFWINEIIGKWETSKFKASFKVNILKVWEIWKAKPNFGKTKLQKCGIILNLSHVFPDPSRFEI